MSCCNHLLYWSTIILLIACEPADEAFAGHLVQLEKETTISLKAGTSTRQILTFQIANGFHILAQEEKESQFLSTKLTFEKTSAITITELNYPKPTAFTIEGLEKPIWVYKSGCPIAIELSVSPEMQKGSYFLTGKLFYQACNEKKCFFPRELPVKLRIVVV